LKTCSGYALRVPHRVSGFRSQSAGGIALDENADDFVFDNEVLAQAVYFKYRIGEVSCPTRYFAEASSIGFSRSVVYGFGVLWTSLKFRLQRMGIASFAIFNAKGTKLLHDYYDQVGQ
jgi:hypothetical protein